MLCVSRNCLYSFLVDKMWWWISCVSVLVVYFLAATSLETTTPLISNLTTDQSALLAFRAHVAPNDVLAHNWSAATSCCSWFGVTCGLRHQRVTALNLNSMGLSGTIPPHLANLSFLASLILSRNSFHGLLPHELGFLHRMKGVDFSYNNLTGEFPLWLGNLTKLCWLFLGSNQFYGRIQWGVFKSTQLQSLSLSINRFTGRIPRGIGNFTMLKELYLGQNNLEGVIPEEMKNLITLEIMSLPINNLTEYGQEGIISSRGDVYSFGILMMETFTRKKPTDEMFVGEMSLKRWVKDSVPHALTQVADANLLRGEEEYFPAKKECISSILNIALACSLDIPGERMDIKDVLGMLKEIRTKLQMSVM